MTDKTAKPGELLSRFPEIHFSNYGQQKVEALQAWALEAFDALSATLSPAHVEDGEEVEVVCITQDGCDVTWTATKELSPAGTALMTVAQHERMMARSEARSAERQAVAEELARLLKQSCDEIRKLRAAALTPPASEQQRAVVMPEFMESADAFVDRLQTAGWRAEADAQHAGVRDLYHELLRLNPHLAKGEGV